MAKASKKAAKKAANLAAKKAADKKTTQQTVEVAEKISDAPGATAATEAPTPKKTPYESYLAYKNHPHMSMVSQKIEKDDKGVEQVITEYKNNETNESVKTQFSVSFVKKGDGIDLDKLREQAEKGMETYMKEHAKPSKEETKKETKKEEKKPEPKKKKEKKEEVIIPEVVKEEPNSPAVIERTTLTKGLTAMANHERMDENHQVEFLSLMHKAYLDNPDSEISPERKAAYKEVFDGGMCQLTLLYAAQLEAEGKAILKGVNVTKEVFPLAKKQFCDMYGVEVKALPSADKNQLIIDFKEVPEEVKKAAAADAKAIKTTEIPEANTELSEEEKLNAIRNILSRSNASHGVVPCRMATNVKDAIDWARKAFDIKSEEPQVTLAALYQKFNDTKTLCLTGFMRKAWGSTTVNRNPFITHALLEKDFAGLYDAKQVAELAKVMISAHAESGVTEGKDFASIIKTINIINSGMNDKTIKSIVKKEEIIPFAVEGLVDDKKNNGIPGAKVYSTLANLYGFASLGDSDKQLKNKLSEISKLYQSPIVRLAKYADESAYSK